MYEHEANGNNRGWNYLVQKFKIRFYLLILKRKKKVNVYKGRDHE
jgi:hypothetical protein